MSVRKPPMILALRVEWYKYREQLHVHQMILLLELQLSNACSDVVHLDCMYLLAVVVVHWGSAPNHGFMSILLW